MYVISPLEEKEGEHVEEKKKMKELPRAESVQAEYDNSSKYCEDFFFFFFFWLQGFRMKRSTGWAPCFGKQLEVIWIRALLQKHGVTLEVLRCRTLDRDTEQEVSVISGSFCDGLVQDYLTSAILLFRTRKFIVVQGCLCTTGCLTASLTSAH